MDLWFTENHSDSVCYYDDDGRLDDLDGVCLAYDLIDLVQKERKDAYVKDRSYSVIYLQ